MNFFEGQWLLVQFRVGSDAFVFPRADIGEIRVVAQRLSLLRLALFSEVAAAGFRAVQRVAGTSTRQTPGSPPRGLPTPATG